MFNHRSVLADSPSFGYAILAMFLYLLRSLFVFVVTFSLAWFGWRLMGNGFLKSFLGFLLFLNCGGCCLWKALDLISFPVGALAVSFSDEIGFVSSACRFLFYIFSLALFSLSILLIVFYIRFLVTPNVPNVSQNHIEQQSSDYDQPYSDNF